MEPPNSWLKSQKAYSATCFCWTSLSQHAAWLVQDPNTHKSLRNDPALSYLRLVYPKNIPGKQSITEDPESRPFASPNSQDLYWLPCWHLSWHSKMTGLSDIPNLQGEERSKPAAESPGQPTSPQFLSFVPHNPFLSNENKVKKQLWQTSNIQ